MRLTWETLMGSNGQGAGDVLEQRPLLFLIIGGETKAWGR